MRCRILFSFVLLAAAIPLVCGCGPTVKDPAQGPDKVDPGKDPGGTQAQPPIVFTDHITADFHAAIVVHPKRIMASKVVANLPQEMLNGLPPDMPDPKQIEQAVVLLAPGDEPMDDEGEAVRFGPPPPKMVVFIRANDKTTLDSLMEEFKEDSEERKHDGKAYIYQHVYDQDWVFPDPDNPTTIAELQKKHGPGAKIEEKEEDGEKYFVVKTLSKRTNEGPPNSVWRPDPTTIVLAHEASLKQVMSPSGGKTDLAKRVEPLGNKHDFAAVILVDGVRDLAKEQGQGAADQFPPAAALLEALDEVTAATITAGPDAKPLLNVSLDTKNPEASGKVKQALDDAIGAAKGLYLLGGKPALQQMDKELAAMADQAVNGLAVKSEGAQVTISVPRPDGFENIGPKLAKLAPGPGGPDGGHGGLNSKNRLRQIAIALHNYHDVHRKFPANIVDKDGKPLLSWRVELLPYLEHGDIYDQIKRDQPWDSVDNRKLLEQVEIFGEPGRSTVLGFSGTGTTLDGKEHAFKTVTDGTSNTLLAIDVSPEYGVPWSQPLDIDAGAENLLEKLGEPTSASGWQAARFDGSVQPVPADISAEELKSLILISDGK